MHDDYINLTTTTKKFTMNETEMKTKQLFFLNTNKRKKLNKKLENQSINQFTI